MSEQLMFKMSDSVQQTRDRLDRIKREYNEVPSEIEITREKHTRLKEDISEYVYYQPSCYLDGSVFGIPLVIKD